MSSLGLPAAHWILVLLQLFICKCSFSLHHGCFPFAVMESLRFILLSKKEVAFVAVWWFSCYSHGFISGQLKSKRMLICHVLPPFLGPALPRQNSQLPAQVQNGPSQEELEIQRRYFYQFLLILFHSIVEDQTPNVLMLNAWHLISHLKVKNVTVTPLSFVITHNKREDSCYAGQQMLR